MTRGRFKNYNSLLYTLVGMLWGTNSLNKTRYHIGWRNPLLNHSFYFIWRTFFALFIGKTNDWAGVLLYYYNRFGQSTLVTFFLSEGHAWCIYRELRLSMLWGNEKKTSNLTLLWQFFYSCQHLLRSNFLIDRKLYQNKSWFYKQSTYVMNLENVERPLRYIKKNL